jgi:hypothetical protein
MLVYRDGIEDMGSSGVMEERFNIFIRQNLHVIGTWRLIVMASWVRKHEALVVSLVAVSADSGLSSIRTFLMTIESIVYLVPSQ